MVDARTPRRPIRLLLIYLLACFTLKIFLWNYYLRRSLLFQLSLFAESFSEMLQYRMGCIILSFLEKLHRRYVIKKNQRKRPREEDPVPVINEDGKLSDKRPKITDGILNNNNPLTNDAMTKVGEEKMNLDSSASAHDEPEAEERMEDEDPEYEEDPEEVEIYASDEDMDNTTAEEQTGAKAEPLNNTEAKQEVKEEDNGNKEIGKELILENIASVDAKPATGVDKQSIAEKGVVQVGKRAVSKEEKTALKQKEGEVVDKDLLQAFRYFDQNKVGYIKVEDLGCIVHNLGKCLPNKDVKDLAETAHAESNSARDGRVIYAKLVKIVDL